MSAVTVNLSGLRYRATIEKDSDLAYWTVRATAEGVTLDRPEVLAFGLVNRKTAERLVAAIEAGAVFHNAEVRTDVNGRTYLQATSRVLARVASADLRRLGF